MGQNAVTAGPRTVFVTGAGGYLGTHAVPSVLATIPGVRVRCLVLPGEALPRAFGTDSRVETVEGDVTVGAETLIPLLGGCEAVLHLAAYGLGEGQTDWYEAFRVNARGSFDLARAACSAGARRFVMALSALEYGPASPGVAAARPVRETDPCFPEGAYAATKHAGADLARAVCAEAGAVFVGLRVFNTYGPWEQPHKLVPANILASLRGRSHEMSSGSSVRDYVFAADVGRAFALALRKEDLAGQRTINIGSGTGISVAEMARHVCAMIPGAPGPVLGARGDRSGEPPFLVADIDGAARVLGWSPSPDRDSCLRATIEWYRAHYPEP